MIVNFSSARLSTRARKMAEGVVHTSFPTGGGWITEKPTEKGKGGRGGGRRDRFIIATGTTSPQQRFARSQVIYGSDDGRPFGRQATTSFAECKLNRSSEEDINRG